MQNDQNNETRQGVLELLLDSESTDHIASSLEISPQTVGAHKRYLMNPRAGIFSKNKKPIVDHLVERMKTKKNNDIPKKGETCSGVDLTFFFNINGSEADFLIESGMIKSLDPLDRVVDTNTVIDLFDHVERESKGTYARNKLVEDNLKFADSYASSYSSPHLESSDIKQESRLGMIEAADTFDETRGFKFITHAVWKMRGNIFAALKENYSLVRVPMFVFADVEALKKPLNKLYSAGLNPWEYLEELEEETGISQNRVGRAISLERDSSLDSTFTKEDKTNLYDVLYNSESHLNNSPDKGIMKSESLETLDKYLSELDVRDNFIVRSYFGLDGKSATLNDIGGGLGLSRERVRQLRDRALHRLRTKLKDYTLEDLSIA